jgi:multimeric flavodoxin WrbA
MKITVLNGSPKGDTSITMQYVKYMRNKFPMHEFLQFNIAQEIKQIEKKQEKFDEVISAVSQSDGVLWAFPLYVMTVHANYMRFIELVSERNAQAAFSGKYTAALSTSIKFFDHTAHSYMRAVCDDLGMKYTGFFSAAMNDLLAEGEREKLEYFTRSFFEHIEKALPVQRAYAPVRQDIKPYHPGPAGAKADNSGKKVLLITESAEEGSNLEKMTTRLLSALASPVEVVDLGRADIKGGCLGCIQCGYNNECAYGSSDDMQELYNVKIKNADIIIFAGSLKGRYLSSRFKMFVDRRFMNTHMPQMEGKQVAFVISGPLSQSQYLSEIFQAMAEMDRANLAGILTDECGSAALDALLDNLAAELVRLSDANYVRPATFLGVGGIKIFRDEIYGSLRFVFQADHRYFKKHGVYDFPQKQLRTRLMNVFMMLLFKMPKAREVMRTEMPKNMIMQYKKVTG